jgi:DNA mismatch repair protein MutS
VAVRREQPRPSADDALAAAIGALQPDEMTPRDALEALYRLRGMASR